jgi:hypothetical protein
MIDKCKKSENYILHNLSRKEIDAIIGKRYKINDTSGEIIFLKLDQ